MSPCLCFSRQTKFSFFANKRFLILHMMIQLQSQLVFSCSWGGYVQTGGCHSFWLSVHTQVKCRVLGLGERALVSEGWKQNITIFTSNSFKKINPKLPLSIYLWKQKCVLYQVFMPRHAYILELEGIACMAIMSGSGYTLKSSLSYVEHFKIHHRFSREKDPREAALSQHLKTVDCENTTTTMLLFVCRDIAFWV